MSGRVSKLLCCVSRDGVPRPLVPCGFRRIIFDDCHNLTHSGIRATIKFISETYTWPTMKKDCTTRVQSCVPCQQTKLRPYTKSPYQHYPLTSERLSEIHLHLIRPILQSDGNRYILMCVGRLTHWFTASASPRQDVQTVIFAFLRDWVSNYGAPLKCATDQAKIFLSIDWQERMKFLGTSFPKSSPYHPQAKAQTELFNLTVKNALKSQLDAANCSQVGYGDLGFADSVS